MRVVHCRKGHGRNQSGPSSTVGLGEWSAEAVRLGWLVLVSAGALLLEFPGYTTVLAAAALALCVFLLIRNRFESVPWTTLGIATVVTAAVAYAAACLRMAGASHGWADVLIAAVRFEHEPDAWLFYLSYVGIRLGAVGLGVVLVHRLMRAARGPRLQVIPFAFLALSLLVAVDLAFARPWERVGVSGTNRSHELRAGLYLGYGLAPLETWCCGGAVLVLIALLRRRRLDTRRPEGESEGTA